MARAFAETQAVDILNSGQVYLTMRVTLIDPETGRREETDATAVFDMMEDTSIISSRIAAAVQAKANELGMSVGVGETLHPGFMRI